MSQEQFEIAPSYFGPRISLIYSWLFLYIGLFLPYFPLWLKSKDLDPTQISLVLAMSLVTRVLTSGQVTSLADRHGERATIVTICYVLSAIAIFLFVPAQTFWQIFLVAILFNIFFNPILPILDAITLAGVRRYDADYGKIRIWGSVVFIIANIGGGIVLAEYDPQLLLYFMIATVCGGAIFSLTLPRIGKRSKAVEQTSIFAQSRLWREPVFLLIVTAAGLLQASHALIYGFGSIYWLSIGLSGFAIGLLWAIGVVAEIIIFQFSKKLLKLYSAQTWLIISCVGALIRWMAFPYVDSELGFFFLQIFHGLSFGSAHIAIMHYLLQSVPEDRLGNAQGVYFVLSGLSMGIMVLLSGPIYQNLGVTGFFTMAAISLLAIICLLVANLISPKVEVREG